MATDDPLWMYPRPWRLAESGEIKAANGTLVLVLADFEGEIPPEFEETSRKRRAELIVNAAAAYDVQRRATEDLTGGELEDGPEEEFLRDVWRMFVELCAPQGAQAHGMTPQENRIAREWWKLGLTAQQVRTIMQDTLLRTGQAAPTEGWKIKTVTYFNGAMIRGWQELVNLDPQIGREIAERQDERRRE